MTFAILTDVTRCIGCERCVDACRETNETGEAAARPWIRDPDDLSSERWTTLVRTPEDRFVRVQCRHCLDPACAAACPVAALHATPEGAVVYDAAICMGCRYCMVACPFHLTRYEWDSPVPRVRKCILCHDAVTGGRLEQPACTAACPTKATIFGDRDALLVEAHRRIAAEPDRYVDHVWGEHEVGGTSVLYVSDVPLDDAGWPARLDDVARPQLAREVLHTVPWTFAGVAAACVGVRWSLERRRKVAAAEAAETAEQNAVEDAPVGPKDEEAS